MKPVRPLTRPLTNRRNRRCGVELSRSPRLPGRRFKSGRRTSQSTLRRGFRTAHERYATHATAHGSRAGRRFRSR
jgi:hypothetical protein